MLKATARLLEKWVKRHTDRIGSRMKRHHHPQNGDVSPTTSPPRWLVPTHLPLRVPPVKQMIAVFENTDRNPMACIRFDHIPTPSAISGSGRLMRATSL